MHEEHDGSTNSSLIDFEEETVNEHDEPSTFELVLAGEALCSNPSERVWVNNFTGEVVQVGCGRERSCVPCAFTTAHKTALAIERAHPNYLVMLSRVGTSWRDIKPRMNEFHRRMRRRQSWSSCFHIHRNENGDGRCHAHLYVRSDEVDPDLVQASAIKSGFGAYVDVRPIRGGWPYSYGMHPVLDARKLPVEIAHHAVSDYFEMNGMSYGDGGEPRGGSLAPHTRNFFLDTWGRPCGIEQARRTPGNRWRIQRLGSSFFTPLESSESHESGPGTNRGTQLAPEVPGIAGRASLETRP